MGEDGTWPSVITVMVVVVFGFCPIDVGIVKHPGRDMGMHHIYVSMYATLL